MIPYRNWFCEYEELKCGDVLVGDASPTDVIGLGNFLPILKDGRRGTVLNLLHIPGLAQNLVFVDKMGVPGVQIVFEKDTCNMV
jgi:hypothetical protein